MKWGHAQHRFEGRAVHCIDPGLCLGASSLGLPSSSEAAVSNLLSRLAQHPPTNLNAYPGSLLDKSGCGDRYTRAVRLLGPRLLPSRTWERSEAADDRGT